MSAELERELFGPDDDETYCGRYCEDDRHAKFCLIGVLGRQDRDEEIARVAALRAQEAR